VLQPVQFVWSFGFRLPYALDTTKASQALLDQVFLDSGLVFSI
jgi:hypothetical protein